MPSKSMFDLELLALLLLMLALPFPLSSASPAAASRNGEGVSFFRVTRQGTTVFGNDSSNCTLS